MMWYHNLKNRKISFWKGRKGTGAQLRERQRRHWTWVFLLPEHSSWSYGSSASNTRGKTTDGLMAQHLQRPKLVLPENRDEHIVPWSKESANSMQLWIQQQSIWGKELVQGDYSAPECQQGQTMSPYRARPTHTVSPSLIFRSITNVFCCGGERQGLTLPWLASNSIFSSGWPRTPGLPASTSQMLGFKLCTITFDQLGILWIRNLSFTENEVA